jgi:signal transduction histidine kinase
MLSSTIDEEALASLVGGLLSVPHVSLWIKDAQLRYVFVTPAWEARAGFSRDVVLGRRDDEFRPAELASLFQQADEAVLASGRVETREIRYETPAGTRSFTYSKFPIRDSSGEIVAVGGVASETTDVRVVPTSLRSDAALTETVLQSMPEAVFRFTPDLTVTFANPAFVALYDRPGLAPVGAHLSTIFSPALVASFRSVAAGLTEARPLDTFERESTHYDGRPRWRQWRLAGAFGPDSQLLEVQAIGSDQTEQRRYQRALEELLSVSVRHTPGPDAAIAAMMNIGRDYFDAECATILRDQPTGPSIRHHVGNARSDDAMLSHLAALPLSLEEPSAASDTRHGGNGVLGTFIGQRIEVDGKPWGAVVFHGRWARATPYSDYAITLQRIIARWVAMAIERANHLDEVSRGRAELSLILDSVPAQVITVGVDGATVTANAAARALPRPTSSVEADAEAFQASDRRTTQLERWEDADGDVRWMQTDRIFYLDAANGQPRLLVVANDVTESVLKELALAKANEGLNQFAYIASHDLQEPLRKIGTFVDILQEGLAAGNAEDVGYATRVIKDSARRASVLIKDLLSWSRLTNRPLDRQRLRFAEVVREVVADVLSARPGSQVEMVDSMEDLVVAADATQVRQLVENLVTNAIKYRHPDRTARIILRLTRSGRRQGVFEIEDNGIGFDPVHASQIFEPFRRLHSERDYAGTGVGLAICARVCEQHGWTIRGRGRPGLGASFRVVLSVESDGAVPPVTLPTDGGLV